MRLRSTVAASSLFLLAVAFAAVESPARAEMLGEWTLLTSWATGDYGTDDPSDTWSADLQYILGDKWQLRVGVPYLVMDTSYGTVRTGAGTVPVGDEGEGRRRGGGDGTGEGGGGGGGQGGGGGGGDGSGTGECPLPYDETADGIGDLRVALSRRLVGGGVKVFRLDAEAEVKVPTADEDSGMGTGEFDYRLGLWCGYRFWSSTLYARAGWNRLGDPWWGDLNDIVDVYLGLESDPLAAERLILSGWFSAAQEAVDDTGETFAIGTSLRTTGRYRWYGRVLVGLGDASPDVSIAIGLSVGRHVPGRIWMGGNSL